MSQQINLLSVEKRAFAPALLAVLVWGVALLGIGLTAAVNQVRVGEAKQNVEISGASVKQAKITYDQRVKETGADIAAQIEAIKPQAERAGKLLGMADALGSEQGYAGHFSTLAAVRVEGVWLDKIKISGSGRALELGGRTLTNGAVLDYSQKLNEAFESKGIKLTKVEFSEKVEAAELVPGNNGGKGGRISVVTPQFTLR